MRAGDEKHRNINVWPYVNAPFCAVLHLHSEEHASPQLTVRGKSSPRAIPSAIIKVAVPVGITLVLCLAVVSLLCCKEKDDQPDLPAASTTNRMSRTLSKM